MVLALRLNNMRDQAKNMAMQWYEGLPADAPMREAFKHELQIMGATP
jgi:hypothetical protein